ncbi:MAG: class I SAM-dependent methyltransferase, partial [Bacteroidota bacterium]
MDQREAFETYEGDEWFRRNLAVKQNYQAANDPIISLIRDYRIQPSSFLELGCSFGYRVNGIKQFFPRAEVQGVDASAEAVAYGKKQFPQIKLTQTGADDLSMFAAGSFDTLVVGFVFYVIDRDRLLKMCAEI